MGTQAVPASTDANKGIRALHFASGLLIASFLLLHMANHVAMFWGQDAHREMMQALRPIYRFAPVELALLAALTFQIGSGAMMIWRTREERTGLTEWAQAVSGAILLLFVMNHVGAVLLGRYALGLDTDYRFAAAGFHAGMAGFFIPYYWLGVTALFVHLGCALQWRVNGKRGMRLAWVCSVTGALFAAGLVTMMARDDAIPAHYLETYL